MSKIKKLTPEEALAALEELEQLNADDPEVQHISSDIVLCQLLNYYQQDEVVEQYVKMHRKWGYV